MPRYFFNVANDVRTEDFDGVILPDIEAAKVEAEKDIVDIKESHFNSLTKDWTKYSIEICQEGAVLLVVPFSRN